MQLPSYQRKYLRELAHALRPIVQVGQEGVSDGVIGAVAQALLDHELIKVRMYDPEDKHAMAAALAERAGACLCGLIGHTAILYRPHPEEPTIVLPTREGEDA